MNNIILIGMPSAGKSTVGVLVAKYTLSAFIDTDLVLQSTYGAPLATLIESAGEDGFLQMEEAALLSLSPAQAVIATGGSAVYSAAGMRHLHALGTVVYLRLAQEQILARVGNLTHRGVILHGQHDLPGIYAERTPYYEREADVTVDCTGLTTEECARAVVTAVRAYRAQGTAQKP